MSKSTVFLFVSGAGSCTSTPDLIRVLVAEGATVYSVVTPNVAQVTDPERLMDVPGNHWIRDYGQSPLDTYPFGVQLVAPCTFNTLNKLASGIADNLATAMIGDAIGAGCRVILAPGMNRGQWAHPRVRASIAALQEWGCEIVPPEVHHGRLTLASVASIRAALAAG